MITTKINDGYYSHLTDKDAELLKWKGQVVKVEDDLAYQIGYVEDVIFTFGGSSLKCKDIITLSKEGGIDYDKYSTKIYIHESTIIEVATENVKKDYEKISAVMFPEDGWEEHYAEFPKLCSGLKLHVLGLQE